MGCLKLTYNPEFLHLVKETAIEKSDHVNFLPLGEKNAGKENRIDYYPFGLTFNSYTRENSTQQNYLYNGKELQDELNLGWYDYQARQYDPAIGRWMAIDPLSEVSRRWSPYTYCYNNPLLFVDPDGMFADYYDQNAKKIGTDGVNDGKVVVVTDKKEAKAISATDKAGGTTSRDNVKSGVELPSASVRAEMGNAVDRSNAPNASVGDTKGGFHEEGGVNGLDANGNQVAAAAQPGDAANPQIDKHADINVWSGDTGNISEVQGSYHVHPSGEVTERPPSNVIAPTTTHGFDQSPSNQDIGNATDNFNNTGSPYHTTGNSYVLGAKSGTVSIYNQCGTIATFPLKQFREIGNNP
ncbi:MAG: RHS repeat-associated core domain-containing protein [Bacteroidota bacterium]